MEGTSCSLRILAALPAVSGYVHSLAKLAWLFLKQPRIRASHSASSSNVSQSRPRSTLDQCFTCSKEIKTNTSVKKHNEGILIQPNESNKSIVLLTLEHAVANPSDLKQKKKKSSAISHLLISSCFRYHMDVWKVTHVKISSPGLVCSVFRFLLGWRAQKALKKSFLQYLEIWSYSSARIIVAHFVFFSIRLDLLRKWFELHLKAHCVHPFQAQQIWPKAPNQLWAQNSH